MDKKRIEALREGHARGHAGVWRVEDEFDDGSSALLNIVLVEGREETSRIGIAQVRSSG